MTPQQRAAMQQAIDALETLCSEMGEQSRMLMNQNAINEGLAAHAALQKSMEEQARTFAEPVTDIEVLAAMEAYERDTVNDEGLMRRALEGLAAGRAAGVEPAALGPTAKDLHDEIMNVRRAFHDMNCRDNERLKSSL